MKAEEVIRDKKRLVLIILVIIGIILITAGGMHLHSVSEKKKTASDLVSEAVEDLQKGNVSDADEILGKKASQTLDTQAMDVNAYMKTIVSSLGYTSGDTNTDAKDSYTDLLKAGGAEDSVIRNMKKLHDTLEDNGITSYEITGKDLKDQKVTVTVSVKGIILLPKVSFTKDVQNANQKLADSVNKNMDALVKTYNQSDEENADSAMNAQLKKQEMDVLLPAMIRRVKKAEKTEETWTFQVDVSSSHAKITSVSVSQ